MNKKAASNNGDNLRETTGISTKPIAMSRLQAA